MVNQFSYKHISVLSYQSLQKNILAGNEPTGYYYIIFDEIHYLTSDAFNQYTDLTYQFLMKQKNNVCVLLSATAKPLFIFLLDKNKVKKRNYFTIEKDYSYVENVYFYKARALVTIIDSILENSPNDKILVFCNSEKRIKEMHDIYKDRADFYCAEDNKRLSEICDTNCLKYYSSNHITFDKQLLFTTKVLDNGIDLKDKNIKHIFTEIFDLESMIQSLGRKRSLSESDTCNFYIKEYTPQGIKCFENKVIRQLEPIDLLKENPDEFYRKYGDGKKREQLKNNKILYMKFNKNGKAKNIKSTNGVVCINDMMYTKFSSDRSEISKMIAVGYIPVVCTWLGAELSKKVKTIDTLPENRDLFLEYLESVKGKFLFKEERNELKKEFEKTGLKDRTMGIHTLNGKLKDMKYSYRIENHRDKRRTLEDGENNPYRDKSFWMIVTSA